MKKEILWGVFMLKYIPQSFFVSKDFHKNMEVLVHIFSVFPYIIS